MKAKEKYVVMSDGELVSEVISSLAQARKCVIDNQVDPDDEVTIYALKPVERASFGVTFLPVKP